MFFLESYKKQTHKFKKEKAHFHGLFLTKNQFKMITQNTPKQFK
ncbi:Hypothetical protein I595_1441 [Croceitalea dokdonensis DOKDO 023]|uniref:Uncharacterized protein n=1 Tax=Croceitalea dokdonensis DOKDO 023 TaxID=1300341 RepID=A0A0P7AWE4_9FLAO|nr:Hypothetical protein I595_1441 [Croceitalea dokdonensis DOKDO 023]